MVRAMTADRARQMEPWGKARSVSVLSLCISSESTEGTLESLGVVSAERILRPLSWRKVMKQLRIALLSLAILVSATTVSVAQLELHPPSLDFQEVMLNDVASLAVQLTSQVVQTVVITSQSPMFSTVIDTLRFTSVGQSLPLSIHFFNRLPWVSPLRPLPRQGAFRA